MNVATKPQSRRAKLLPGAIFSVPQGGGYFAFGKLTPQSGVADFYKVKSRGTIEATILESYPTFRLKTGITLKPFREGRWVVYDSVECSLQNFKLVVYRMGGLICCGTRIVNGFIDTSSATRVATEDELQTVPPLSIANMEMVEYRLAQHLSSAPTL
jgi:hypothetical protein